MDRIAVTMETSATTPVSRVDDLEQHLGQLATDPTLPTDNKLFDHVEIQMTGIADLLYLLPDANTPPLIPRLLPKITHVLTRYQRDPIALCSLASRLLRPLTFHQIMSFASEEALIQALASPAPPANLLAMTILAKAAETPGDAAVLAAMKGVVTRFVTTWLSAPAVEVGEKGTGVLGDLLVVDSPELPPKVLDENQGIAIPVLSSTPGQGFMWRRIFNDRDVYGLILSLCSKGPHHDVEGGLTPQQLSLAQGRLLRLLPRLSAYNLATIARTNFPDLHQQSMNSEAPGGLLYFAALHMIDRDDILMHLSLVDFFERLLSIQRITPPSTFKMETLRKLYREVAAQDKTFSTVIQSLPDRTIPEEADALRQFIHEVTSD
ncbi:hypothetical protein F5B22DRAFT_658806 [Xylaria bambusicola]|uniref:uncharacterized protein n=1 Tax=Xylaria bambusicola TaxID=326684 RepID=UPI0020083B79|nr:uncharacterized protein F5B22DRAFT_658806 [Xylaria bambusicola]KAI0508892.1 hypothetical protein F5B22DRAFT_658806 [Xylaria bambusicola]